MPDPSHHKRLRLAPVCLASLLVLLVLSFLLSYWSTTEAQPAALPAVTPTYFVYMPAAFRKPHPPLPIKSYLPAVGQLPAGLTCPTTSTRAWGQMGPRQGGISGASGSPDVNLNVRGWYRVNEGLGYSKYSYPGGSPPDTQHPLRLSNIVAGGSASYFVSTYQINDWDWFGCNCPVPRDPDPYPVTLLGLRTVPAQPLRIPSRNIAVDPEGFAAMVVYADPQQLALKYTWEDRVDTGYMVHLEHLCVDPNLVALYNRLDAEGRHSLPGVFNNNTIGTALGTEVDVAVRDSGSFLDPRSWQDWWSDKPGPTATPARTPSASDSG